jgi:hypothetical protein
VIGVIFDCKANVCRYGSIFHFSFHTKKNNASSRKGSTEKHYSLDPSGSTLLATSLLCGASSVGRVVASFSQLFEAIY